MTDSLLWSPISLGRWGGTQVRVHFTLIFILGANLLRAALTTEPRHIFWTTLTWEGLLLLAILLHELGHAAMAAWVGAEQDDIRIWPLGNMVGPTSLPRSGENILVPLGGPIVNFVLVLACAAGLAAAGAGFVWIPFGNSTGESGAPWVLVKPNEWKQAAPFTVIWAVGWFGYLNWVLLVANTVLPALPFDMGRVLRSYLANTSIVPTKDGLIAPWTARSTAIVLGLVGLIVMFKTGAFVGVTVIMIAFLIELFVRTEARMMEDGGYFEDGVFGYDFSEGYTSLESSAAKVRPYRESALKRWRRRRSEHRRQRRLAREAAEERRMDEILEKLYREGRASLSDEEQRFLVRVSAKYRNRPKMS